MRRAVVVALALTAAALAVAAVGTQVRNPLTRDDRRFWRIYTSPNLTLEGGATVYDGGHVFGSADAGNTIFVTSMTFTGNLGGLAGADIICRNHAADAGLSGNFIALLNSSTVTAYGRLPIDGGWVRTDGLPVAASREQLFGGAIWYQPNLDEHGTITPYDPLDAGAFAIWGAQRDGGTATGNCSDWASTSGSGDQGIPDRNNSGWIDRGATASCALTRPIYCVSNAGALLPTAPVRAPRLVFLTQTTLDGGSSLQVMDQTCINEARDAGLSGTFVAWVAPDSGTPPIARVDAGPSNWSRVDGAALTRDGFIIRDAGFWLTAPYLRATGAPVVTSGANTSNWTGAPDINTATAQASQDCNGWSGGAAGSNEIGTATRVSSGVDNLAGTFNSTGVVGACSASFPFLCIQTDILPDAGYHFCDALPQGKRSGTWGCVNGDLSATPGDNLGPWTASGTTYVSGGSTCGNPQYTALDGTIPNYVVSNAAVTSVPSAFTICGLYQTTTAALGNAFFWGTYPCCSDYTLTTEQSVTTIMYPSGGTSTNTAVTVGTNDTALVCYTYSGGTEHAYIKSSGGVTAYTTTGTAAPAGGAGHKIHFGSEGLYRATGRFLGGFYTETALSQSDMDTIYTNTVTCP